MLDSILRSDSVNETLENQGASPTQLLSTIKQALADAVTNSLQNIRSRRLEGRTATTFDEVRVKRQAFKKLAKQQQQHSNTAAAATAPEQRSSKNPVDQLASTDELRQNFRDARKRCDKLLKERHRAAHRKVACMIDRTLTSDPKSVWNFIKRLMGHRAQAHDSNLDMTPPQQPQDRTRMEHSQTAPALATTRHPATGTASFTDAIRQKLSVPRNTRGLQILQALREKAEHELSSMICAGRSITCLRQSLRDVDTELDRQFSPDEILQSLQRLKRHKAPGLDGIPADLLKPTAGNTPTRLANALARLMNAILETGEVPPELGYAVLTGIPKDTKGDLADPTNYRPIAVSSAIAKIVSCCLHVRLSEWCEGNKLLPDEQPGFRPGRSITDHHFVVRTLVDDARNNGKALYATFADVKGAYDVTSQPLLLKKLYDLGVPPHMLRVLMSWYNVGALCVRENGDKLSAPFPQSLGMKQGDILSPLLYAIYMKDLPELLKKAGCNGVVLYSNEMQGEVNKLGLPHDTRFQRCVRILQYADDILVLSENPHDHQLALDVLSRHAEEHEYTFNPKPTKSAVMIFGFSWAQACELTDRHRWTLGGHILQCVREYKYLGVPMHQSGVWSANKTRIIAKAERSHFAWNKLHKSGLLLSRHKLNRNIHMYIYEYL